MNTLGWLTLRQDAGLLALNTTRWPPPPNRHFRL